MRVPLVEGGIFQDEHDVALNPELEIANGQQNALGLTAAAPVLAEASGQCLLLPVDGQFR